MPLPLRGLPCLPLLLLVLASAQAQQSPRVSLAGVERGALENDIPLNGTVTALRQAQLSVEVSGRVANREVDVGARVEGGDVLMRLDQELAQLELEQAQAERRASASQLAEAERLLREARSVGAGTNIAATEVARRESQIATATAELARAEATEELAAARLRRHQLRAPFTGLVTDRSVDEGEWVTPGTAVFTLIDPARLRLDFQVPQQAFAGLENAPRLLVEGADNSTHEAEIEFWLPAAEGPTRTFLLRARPPAELSLQPGTSVTATLRLTRDRETLAVPRDALNRYPEGRTTVWVAQPAEAEGRFSVNEQRVELIGSAGEHVFIASGLDGDEQVVVRGNESLRDGVTVELAEDGR